MLLPPDLASALENDYSDRACRWTRHAREQLVARISEELVEQVLRNPQQIVQDVAGNPVAQSRYFDVSENQEMLLRVFYVEGAGIKRVTTLYKTSQIRRYWKEGL